MVKTAQSAKPTAAQEPSRRIAREKRTVAAMIAIYCRRRHGSHRSLCPECAELRQYAFRRLDRCRFGDAKPTCAQCAIHCYKPEMREKIKQVMRFAGPRMLLRHPVLALLHQWDNWCHRRRAQSANSGGNGCREPQDAQAIGRQ